METPVNWLWEQLKEILTDTQLQTLRTEYIAYSKKYTLNTTIRRLEKEIKMFESAMNYQAIGSDRYTYYEKRIEKHKAKLIRLRATQD